MGFTFDPLNPVAWFHFLVSLFDRSVPNWDYFFVCFQSYLKSCIQSPGDPIDLRIVLLAIPMVSYWKDVYNCKYERYNLSSG